LSDGDAFAGIVRAGEVLLDKYRVERVLGAGGMGLVVAATHLALEQPIAIKFLLAKAARNPKSVARFLREARAAARIQSEHVARVSDVGTAILSGAPDHETPYMVMEYLDGEDLAQRLTRGPIAVPQAVRFLLQACEAVAEAHAAGIIHRDLKPANLFIAKRPGKSEHIKVLDFGISKILTDSSHSIDDLTKTSTLMGSPLYMAPEQMLNVKTVDARADLWALGCILFECISGRPPYTADTLPALCALVVSEEPMLLRAAMPNATEDLERVVGGALQKELSERYADLAAFASALVPFGDEDAAHSADTVRRVLGVPEQARPPSPTASAVPDTQPMAPAGQAEVHPTTPATASGEHAAAPITGTTPLELDTNVGASTAEPVSNTMPETAVPLTRTPWQLIAVGLVLILAAASAAGYRLLSSNSTAPSADDAAPASPPSYEAASAKPTSAPSASPSAPGPSSTVPVASANAAATTPRRQAPARRTPKGPPRLGDDLFKRRQP